MAEEESPDYVRLLEGLPLQLSDWLALVAVVVSIVALWNARSMRKRERRLDFLARCHAQMEGPADELSAAWQKAVLYGAEEPTVEDVIRLYRIAQRVYSRARPHLPFWARYKLYRDDKAIGVAWDEEDEDREAPHVFRRRLSSFVSDLERALDRAAHRRI